MKNNINIKIVKFIINWIIMSLSTLIILNVFYKIWIWYIESTIFWYTIMIIINYIISYKHIFKWKRNIKTFFNFIHSHIIWFLIFTTINIYLFNIWINIYLWQLIAIWFSAISNFLYNNYITFKK